jgi:Uri superfamily endonuclease
MTRDRLADLPAETGSYALAGWLDAPVEVFVGGLGQQRFPAGGYAYFGSAFGPGGLRARVGRHLRFDTPSRWHLDYLKPRLRWIWVAVQAGQRVECAWAQAAAALPGSEIPVPGFGSSDCRAGCRAHLMRIAKLEPLANELTQAGGQVLWLEDALRGSVADLAGLRPEDARFLG